MSILYIFVSLFMYGISNDYLFYQLQNVTETLEGSGHLNAGTANLTQTFGDSYTNFNFHIDDLWFISYLIFFISSITVAYKTRIHGYFTKLGFLFYFIMFVLFLLSIFSTLTDWFNTEILEKVFPTAIIFVPKFYWYVAHLGIVTLIHLVLCTLISMVDFDIAKIVARRKQEEQVLEDNERL